MKGSFVTPPASGIPACPPPSTELAPPWTPLEAMEKTDYDVVIVGTGAGGSAALWRLAQQWGNNGRRIGVVETGDYLLPAHRLDLPDWYPLWSSVEPLNPLSWKTIPIFPCVPNPLPPYITSFEQFLALGGRTIKWGIVAPRMSPVDLASFPVPPEEMNMYYNIAEEIMNVNQSFYRPAPFLLNRLRQNGFPDAEVTPVAVDILPTAGGEFHPHPRFTAIPLFAEAAKLNPFDIAVRTRAVQVYAEKGRVAGLRVMSRDKKSYFLKSKVVILAASAFGTPAILLYSGIRGDAVGHYLTTHTLLYTVSEVDPADFPLIQELYAIIIPRTADRPYQLQMRGFPPLGREVDILGLGMVESRYENRVVLNPLKADGYGIPETVGCFSFSQKDMEIVGIMDRGMKHAAEVMQVTPDPICQNVSFIQHDMGTCRIGRDPSTSAADPYGQIHGVSGLYVADSSMLPTTGAANPMLTVVALSIRTADYIVEQLK